MRLRTGKAKEAAEASEGGVVSGSKVWSFGV